MKQHPSWLIANWKMYGSADSVRGYAFAINSALSRAPASITGVFCPPLPYLALARAALPYNSRLKIGAQNCHGEKEGAHTGETSAPMLADNGCGYVIIGHSERRAGGETDAAIATKLARALEAGLVPILCVGESAEAHAAGTTTDMLSQQLALLGELPLSRVLIAYEPIWAIGSGKTPTAAEIAAAHRHIKSVLGSETSVLYGGSVNARNLREILSLPEVSGALIGSASLKVSDMEAIIAAAAEVRG